MAGVPAEAKAFARASDFEAAIKNKQVDFAVIDGVYLAERGVPYAVLATATSGGETAPQLGAVPSTATRVDELQGKKLRVATAGGARRGLRRRTRCSTASAGRRSSSRRRPSAPDLASAVASVYAAARPTRCSRPSRMGKGLKKLFDVRERVPNPAFCEVASGLPNDLVDKVKQAVLAHGAAGWRSTAGRPRARSPYRSLAGRMSAKCEAAGDGRARSGAHRRSGRAGAAVAGAGRCPT